MNHSPMWRRYLRFWRPDVAADVDDELRFHLEMREQEMIAEGHSPTAARAAARERFGPVEPVRGACEAIDHAQERRMTIRTTLGTLRRDLRLAVRALRRRPALTLATVTVLALGIGAATAMFGVVRGVLLRPLPVRDQARLGVLWLEQPSQSFGHWPVPYAAAVQYAAATRAFSAVASVDYNGAFPQPLRRGADVLRIRGTWVGGTFFDVLGVRPSLGRLLGAADDLPTAAPVMVIGHALWRREFGADPRVVGQTLRWRDRAWTVVGVAAPGFAYPAGAEFWTAFQAVLPGAMVSGSRDDAYAMVDVIGRLRPGRTLDDARAELTTFARTTPGVLPPNSRAHARAVARPFTDLVVGDVRPTLWSLSAATGLVLLIACANVAALLLIAGNGRRRELAVRTAIGAGRGHLVRQLVTESAILAALGGVLGALVAAVAVRGLVALAPPELPRLDDIRLDGTVLAFAVACTAAATLLAGLAPAVLLTRRAIEPVLRAGHTGATARAAGGARRGQLAQRTLVAGQLALALVVLVGAALLGRSLLALQRVDMGFATDRLLVVQPDFPMALWEDDARLASVADRLTERIRAIPGVASVSFVNAPPFSGPGGWDAPAIAEGQTDAEAATNPMLDFEPASGAYFETMEIPILRGRALGPDDDRPGAAPVTVVSERAARGIWKGADPLGKRLRLGRNTWLTVVGIAGDARYREFLDPRPAFYVPPRPNGLPGLGYLAVRVRGTGDALAVVPALRAAVREIEPNAAIVSAATMRELMAAPLARPRLAALLLGLFAAAAVLLAAVGVYGMMAALVAQRTREIGVRLALGARVGDVVRWVLAYGLRLAALGAVVGLAAALAGTRWLRTQLYGISPTDPLTLVATLVVLLLVAAAACTVPALRATRVSPRDALRAEP